MKKIYTFLIAVLALPLTACATDGWPKNYGGVMLQGFYWDSYSQTKWTNLERQAAELGQYFDLVWLPQSASCGSKSMGYDDLYWFDDYNSSFGTADELRSLIATFRANGIGTIADVVINHRRTLNQSFIFPKETYRGETYQLLSTDICANDQSNWTGQDGQSSKTYAANAGYEVSSNNDTGEGWTGMPDLDHKSANVQRNVKAYLDLLRNDFGYVGFRYDMVKGYGAEFTAIYNQSAQPEFSVGECWDGTATIRRWIDGTAVNGTPTSAAFDFPFRYTVRNAANNSNWARLGQQDGTSWPLVSSSYQDGGYRQWAVTFVENHDTERRSNAAQDPLKRDTLAANAYMLAMPGTPCVFLTHWLDCKAAIKSMIDVRKLCGITNTSRYENLGAAITYYANRVEGNKANLIVVVGPQFSGYMPGSDYVLALQGYHYRYYVEKKANTAWVDLASGTFEEPQTATLTAITTQSDARLVYTTDGSVPTAQSTQVASGTQVTIPYGTTTLKVGLLTGQTVSGIVTRTYEVKAFEPYQISVFVNTDKVGWNAVNFWTWGGDNSHTPKNTQWPGDKVTATVTVDGKQWYKQDYTINSPTDYVNFVFSTNSGSPQTVDVENVTTTSFFEVSAAQSGSNYLVNDVSSLSGIGRVVADDNAAPQPVYNLSGQRVSQPLAPGIYIQRGHKFVVK